MKIARQHYPYFLAISIGLFYALVARFILGEEFISANGLLTGSFLLITPMAIGAITAHCLAPAEGKWRRLVVAPFFAVMLFLFSALLFHLEGLICLAIIGPMYLVLAFFGAFIYSVINDLPNKKPNKTLAVAAFALLPFIAAPLENQFNNPNDFRRVENTVEIHAPAAVVWQHIIRVAPIQAQDLGHSLIDDIGFPRPVEATLTYEGVGGVRHATFERGVEFIETVDEWVPQQRLSFSIVPNTATIPPTTFDEHVIVGGRFFDVLRGTYELRPVGPGRTLLVLHSQQRLSTHLNWYAGLWTGYVMSEIQGRILTVLKRRCEAAI
ncbi:SRPBCC family protein [Hymenobacter daeguensis]